MDITRDLANEIIEEFFRVQPVYAAAHFPDELRTEVQVPGTAGYTRRLVVFSDPTESPGESINDSFDIVMPSNLTTRAAALGLPSAVGAVPVAWVGLWSSATSGVLRYMIPIGHGDGMLHSATVSSADLFSTESDHGLVAGDTILFERPDESPLPDPLIRTLTYYVISSGLTSAAFKASTTVGGSSVNITSNSGIMNCIVRKYAPALSGNSDTLSFQPGSLTLRISEY